MLPSNAALFAATSVLQPLCCYLFADVCVCAVCVLCAQIKEGARLCALAQFKDNRHEYNAAYRRSMMPEESTKKATKKARQATPKKRYAEDDDSSEEEGGEEEEEEEDDEEEEDGEEEEEDDEEEDDDVVLAEEEAEDDDGNEKTLEEKIIALKQRISADKEKLKTLEQELEALEALHREALPAREATGSGDPAATMQQVTLPTSRCYPPDAIPSRCYPRTRCYCSHQPLRVLSFTLSQFDMTKLMQDGNITLTDAFPIEDDFIKKLRAVRFKKTDSIFNHDPRKTRTHDPRNCRQQVDLASDLRKSLDERLRRALRNLVSLLSDATLPMLPFRCYPSDATLRSHFS